MNYTHRYLARIVIEAETPIAVGNGERGVMTDRLVATDVNGLPFIPGTALAGVLRNALKPQLDKIVLINLFGYSEQEVKEENKGKKESEKDKGQGSRLILSSAQMVGNNGKVIDGLQTNVFEEDFYKNFQNLPIRQHVRISHKGAAEKHGKFDEQVVYKGTRFCFEIELIGNADDLNVWEKLKNEFSNPAFRIGGGTRKGFGAIGIQELKSSVLIFPADLEKYLAKTSELNDDFWISVENTNPKQYESDWNSYELTLTPDDFMLFGSGYGNDEADMTFVTEKIIDWDKKTGTPNFTEEKVLIPATSVKGALAHRVAFHYNKLCGITSEKLKESGSINDLCKSGFYDFRNQPNDRFDSEKYEDRIKLVTTYNPAVRNLFGFALDDEKDDGSQRGNVIFSDIFLNPAAKKLLNHVAIDRFTGGAMDGALFSEEVAQTNESFMLRILVNNKAFKNESIKKSFEKTLEDLCSGMLPLGGGTMRGNGCFCGTFTTNGKPYEKPTED